MTKTMEKGNNDKDEDNKKTKKITMKKKQENKRDYTAYENYNASFYNRTSPTPRTT